jgi:hypothetical protein
VMRAANLGTRMKRMKRINTDNPEARVFVDYSCRHCVGHDNSVAFAVSAFIRFIRFIRVPKV